MIVLTKTVGARQAIVFSRSPSRSTCAAFATCVATYRGAARGTCAACPSCLAGCSQQVRRRHPSDGTAHDIGERRLRRFRNGRDSIQATILTSDLNFPLAGRFLEHFSEALSCA
jgi:hypothetical protein